MRPAATVDCWKLEPRKPIQIQVMSVALSSNVVHARNSLCRVICLTSLRLLSTQSMRSAKRKQGQGRVSFQVDTTNLPTFQEVTPRCSHFGTCGGCQLQHMPYNIQLEWKRSRVSAAFAAEGIDVPVNAAVPSPVQYGYRSKLTPHYGRPRAGVELPMGFDNASGPRGIVNVDACPLAMDTINAALPGVIAHTRATVRSNREGSVLLRASAVGVHDIFETVLNSQGTPGKPRKPYVGSHARREDILEREYETVTAHMGAAYEVVCGYKMSFKAGEFFQTNSFLLPAMVDYTLKEAKGPAHATCTTLVDTYCGAGLFSICGSGHFEQCIGVEVSAANIECAVLNAQVNNITNCSFRAASAETIFDSITTDPSTLATIIDPPRAGCSDVFIESLLKLAPRRVVYVACNHLTQVRDCKRLLEGGYAITSVTPFDMFPQTRHIESIVTLEVVR